MTKKSLIGYPRIGAHRELKKLEESYFKGEIDQETLLEESKKLRLAQWRLLFMNGMDMIPSGDYSLYDGFLDTAFQLNVIPAKYQELGLNDLDTYFAMARGYQKGDIDVKALTMRKWFNTNYHYMMAEIEDDVKFQLHGSRIFDHYLEAKEQGIETKPVMIGPLTFLKLARYTGKNKDYGDYIDRILPVYISIMMRLEELGTQYIQLDEPILVTDLDDKDRKNFKHIYDTLLENKGELKVILQTYFGDVRDLYQDIIKMDFDAIGLDFIEGTQSLELVEKYGFPEETILIAGIVNGKNIWRNDYSQSLKTLSYITAHVHEQCLAIGPSCSLLHVPYTIENEEKMDEKYKKHLVYAEEKLLELNELSILFSQSGTSNQVIFERNQKLLDDKRDNHEFLFQDVRDKISDLKEEDFQRQPSFEERIKIQQELLDLPPLPTTTIGSFPQNAEVRRIRRAYKKDQITKAEYVDTMKDMIKEVVQLQEEIGLDVLVHGEFERNDMVEYFGENLTGFIFTENAWVQSYGTRAVKPPIIFGDVKRERPMTVEWSVYAQSLTKKPMKGMLTGPVTILNWSFPREDISREAICYQIGLAIRDEVLDLEAAGIKIIQIDEAALREKLPLRQEDWKSQYLDWAIPAFKLVHAKVRPETQIHTHMCYSEFGSIIESIEAMNADVLSCEAARSDLTLLDFLREKQYHQQVGPGLYDIHSPRIPSENEFKDLLSRMIRKLPQENLWVNPDCGLKTRGKTETVESLRNMVAATLEVRKTLK